MVGPVQYASSPDGSTLAYRIIGEGEIDGIFVPGILSHVEFALEEETEDLITILDAAGVERVALCGYTGGAALAAQFAALYPERTRALVFYAPIIRTMATEGYEWASQPEERAERFAAQANAWGAGSNLELIAPSFAGDERVREWLGRMERGALSPGTLRRMIAYQETIDARPVLPDVTVPTLVLHREDDRLIDVRHSRYAAEHIPGAKLVLLPGADDLPSAGDAEA